MNIDVNECLENNGKGPCEDVCENREGSFSCRCTRPGYELDDNGKTCFGKQSFNMKIVLNTCYQVHVSDTSKCDFKYLLSGHVSDTSKCYFLYFNECMFLF